MMPVLRPLHQGISVPDMDASIAWYQKIFGCTVLSDDVMPPLQARVVFLSLGDFQLELFQYLGEDAQPLPHGRRIPNEDLKTCGTKHVAYGVPSMEETVAWLDANGVDFAMRPFLMPSGPVCFIRDNAGTLIELIQI